MADTAANPWPTTATLAEIERTIIADAFNRHAQGSSQSRERVAVELGLGIRTVTGKLRELGVPPRGADPVPVPPLPQTLLRLAAHQQDRLPPVVPIQLPPEIEPTSCSLVQDWPPTAAIVETELFQLLAATRAGRHDETETKVRRILAGLQSTRLAARRAAA